MKIQLLTFLFVCLVVCVAATSSHQQEHFEEETYDVDLVDEELDEEEEEYRFYQDPQNQQQQQRRELQNFLTGLHHGTSIQVRGVGGFSADDSENDGDGGKNEKYDDKNGMSIQ
jgi:uncharacterized protein YlxW (UPF0749 family)